MNHPSIDPHCETAAERPGTAERANPATQRSAAKNVIYAAILANAGIAVAKFIK